MKKKRLGSLHKKTFLKDAEMGSDSMKSPCYFQFLTEEPGSLNPVSGLSVFSCKCYIAFESSGFLDSRSLWWFCVMVVLGAWVPAIVRELKSLIPAGE